MHKQLTLGDLGWINKSESESSHPYGTERQTDSQKEYERQVDKIRVCEYAGGGIRMMRKKLSED